jgi:glycosyltransferase involved in cell wall biosynthesis
MRVVRLIARLNVGGPAIQAITLTSRMRGLGYETTLLRGVEGPGEGSMDDLAEREGVRPELVPSLQRALGIADLRALLAVVRVLRRDRPAILHTHTAKAGTIGRLAALVPGKGRPRVVVHTFHGHVFAGYFSPRATRFFLAIERFLARRSTCLVAVSDEVRDDLVSIGVAPADRIVVVPLGFELERFAPVAGRRAEVRAELGIASDAPVVLLVARLVPIKRVDRFLEVAAAVTTPGVRFLVAGDGELRDAVRSSAAARAVAHQVTWLGMRSDIDRLLAAADVSVLCSDNEGTPVSLIESQAAGVPVVSTAVGGVAAVVIDGVTGILVDREDTDRFAAAIDRLLGDPDRRREMGEAGRRHVLSRFALSRLIADIDALYRRLLETR